MCYDFPSDVCVRGIPSVNVGMLDLRCKKNFPEKTKDNFETFE